MAAVAVTAAALTPVVAFFRHGARSRGSIARAERWLRPARLACGPQEAARYGLRAAASAAPGRPTAPQARPPRLPRRSRRGAEAEIVGGDGHASGDPFTRLSIVLRDTELDTPAKVLDPTVDLASVPLQRAVDGIGAQLEDPVLARSLWSEGGALIVVVRRPGCWLCREAAYAASRMIEENPQLSGIRLAAIVKESRVNDDGSSELELFSEYLPGGDVYVDATRGFFRALGNRDFFPFLSREGLAYARQRADGMREYNIQGNLNGFFFEPTLLGGMLLVSPSGQVEWAHQEGNGPISFEDLEAAANTLVASLAVSEACQKVALADGADRSWLEWAVDSAAAQEPTN